MRSVTAADVNNSLSGANDLALPLCLICAVLIKRAA